MRPIRLCDHACARPSVLPVLKKPAAGGEEHACTYTRVSVRLKAALAHAHRGIDVSYSLMNCVRPRLEVLTSEPAVVRITKRVFNKIEQQVKGGERLPQWT